MTLVTIFQYMQYFPTFQKKRGAKIYYRRDYRNYNDEVFVSNIASSSYISFYNSDCIIQANCDKSLENFVGIIKSEINKTASTTKFSRRKSKLALNLKGH